MKKKRKDCVRTAMYLAPSLAGTCVFYVIPFVIVIIYAFCNNPIQKEFVGLHNFATLLQNKAFLKAASNSILFSVTAVPCAIILPLLVANVLISNIPNKGLIRNCLISPIMVPTASVILVWQVLFGYHGQVNIWMMKFFGQRIDWLRSSYGMIVIGVLYLWKNFGYHMIIFLSALSEVPKELVEAAKVDGAGAAQIFLKIKLRFISPSIVFVTLLAFVSSFKVFREVYLLTGDYPHESLYMLQHFMNNTFATLDYQKMSAAAILISLVLFVFIGGLFLLEHIVGRGLEE